ncbi:MAG: cytochrome C [Nitrospirae bacterium]|nr:cytochrome C [Nitrospirota bacterium]
MIPLAIRRHAPRLLLIITILSVPLSAAYAIQVGKTVVYTGGNMGRVVFDGRAHNEAGYHCMKCHNVYFIPKIGAVKITYADHTTGKELCFGCHDGSRAFDARANCNRCHRK